jgi:hypothetical protein
MKLGGRAFEATPGDTIVIEPGKRHYFRNDGDEVAHFKVDVRPALGIEALMETMYGLAADGKTNRSGLRNPLQLAVVAAEHFDTVRLPIVPAWIQRTALGVARASDASPASSPSTSPPPSPPPPPPRSSSPCPPSVLSH